MARSPPQVHPRTSVEDQDELSSLLQVPEPPCRSRRQRALGRRRRDAAEAFRIEALIILQRYMDGDQSMCGAPHGTMSTRSRWTGVAQLCVVLRRRTRRSRSLLRAERLAGPGLRIRPQNTSLLCTVNGFQRLSICAVSELLTHMCRE